MPVTFARLQDVAAFSGPSAIPGIRFRPLRAAAGVTAWGMNVIELDPGCERYPEHDHQKDGQEEVYLVLAGSVVLQAEGAEKVLSTGDLARVPSDVKRKLVTRETGAVVLALGGTPGKPYQPR